MDNRHAIPLLLATVALAGVSCILVGEWYADGIHMQAAGCAAVFGTVCASLYALDRLTSVSGARGIYHGRMAE